MCWDTKIVFFVDFFVKKEKIIIFSERRNNKKIN